MLKEEIKTDLKNALKGKRELEVLVLRMVLAAVLNKEKEKRYKISKEKQSLDQEELQKESQLTDEEIVEVIFSENKKRKDAIVEFEKGERIDLAEKEKAEIEVLKKYLPEQVSEQEIKELAQKVIKEVGAKELKDMGQVMGALMPKLKGKADGGVISGIVKKLLS